MAELKATEEALVRERERMSHDTEVLRNQVMETERDLDSNVSKYKSTITSLREESDRYRRAAYTLEAETNKLKVQLEGKKREVDRLAAEMEVSKVRERERERERHGTDQFLPSAANLFIVPCARRTRTGTPSGAWPS
jgi:hypothetical protein